MLSWSQFFQGKALDLVIQNIDLALLEDGVERTAEGIFLPDDPMQATIRAKEDTLVVGLPLIGIILRRMHAHFEWKAYVREGASVKAMTTIALIKARAIPLLKAERIILNYICHLSGVANLTQQYVKALVGTKVSLLDTRKTTPGLRYLEKYAVQCGGGTNHRMNLEDMLMLKDNHIDAVGSISRAVALLRQKYVPCPPIEVECRTLSHVREAIAASADRIMLDNMSVEQLCAALQLVPESIETEVSGGVTLETIRQIATACPCQPDFISVGRLTHSARAADFSMTLS